MNRNTFIFSFAFESFFAFAAIGLLFNNVGSIVYLYALLALSAVLAPFFIRLKYSASTSLASGGGNFLSSATPRIM